MPPETPPVPVLATYHVATSLLTVTFDQPLQPGTSAIGNWRCWVGDPGTVYRKDNDTPATIAGSTVTATMPPGVVSTGPNRCRYFAAPADVLGLTGLPAAPWTSFPVTMI